MRFRFTLFLLVANLVVFGLIWNNARSRNVAPPRAELVFPTEPDRIVVATGDAETSYSLARDASRWSLHKPYRWPANAWAVRKMLDGLRDVSHSGSFSLEDARRQGGATDKDYGLDKPVCTLTVAAAGRNVTVKIGRSTDDGSASYMLAGDGVTILRAPSRLVASLLQPPEALRREEVFDLDDFEITSVNISSVEKGAGIGARLVRAKRDLPGGDFKSVWTFEIPVKSDADTALVKNELAALVALKYRRFFDATPDLLKSTGLVEPKLSLTLNGNNRSRTLQIGLPDDKTGCLFAKLDDNPVIFTIPESVLLRWRNVSEDMRDPHLLRMDDATLAGITIRIDGIPLMMKPEDVPAPAKPGSVASAVSPTAVEWRMPVVPGGKVRAATSVDPDVFNALYRSLAMLQARDVQPPAGATPETKALCRKFVTDNPTPEELKKWGFDNAKWHVELTFVRGDKTTFKRLLTIAKDPSAERGTPLHAMTGDSSTVYSIGNAIVAEPLADLPGVLSVNPETYRRRLLFAMQPGDTLLGLEITDLAGGAKKLDETKPADVADWKTWLTGRPDAAKVGALADAVAELRVRGFLETPYSENFKYDAGDGSAPEPWRYRIVWKVKPAGTDGTRIDTHVMLATRRLGGATEVGGIANAGIIFKLPQSWVDALAPFTTGDDATNEFPKPAEPAKPTDAPVKPVATPAAK